MTDERKGAERRLGKISPLRDRVASYREQAARFTRLAEAEPVERIRDQWKNLARDYDYLARNLEDGV